MINRFVIWVRSTLFLGIVTLSVLFYLGYGANFFQAFENKIWNFFQQQGEANTSFEPKTVIITIDKESLKVLGYWHYSRQKILELVRILLDDYHVSIIGFDMYFPATSDSEADRALLHLAQQHKLVFSQLLSIDKRASIKVEGVLGAPLNTFNSALKQHFPPAFGYTANNAILAQAPCIGHITPKTDWDGITRLPAFIHRQNQLYPSFALEMIRCFMQNNYHLKLVNKTSSPSQNIQIFDDIDFSLSEKKQLVLDKQGYWRIPYAIAQNQFIAISALDIFTHKNPKKLAKLLNNQMVIIAASAPGLGDLHITPQGTNVMGATIHIQLIEWLLSDAPLLPAAQLDLLTWIWLIVTLSLLYFMLFKGVSVFYLLLSNLLLALTWLALGYYMWIMWLWWLPILPLLAYILFAMLQIPTEWAMTQQRAIQLRQLFQGYLPVPVVESLVYKHDKTLIEPKRCELSILFADIANFTQRAEACKPEKIARLTQQILEGLTQVVYECEGTLDKYMGDAVMAFWNAPLEQNNHADLAVKAGIHMIEAIEAFNQCYRDDKKFEPITIRIGIHTGEVIVGNLGTKYRHAYTALGDAVNVAARLQEKAKDLQETVVVSETTVAALQQSCPLVKKESVSLRGRKKEVGIYILSAHNRQSE